MYPCCDGPNYQPFSSGAAMNQLKPSAASRLPADMSGSLEAALRAGKKAPATFRAYKSAWTAWTDWAAIRHSVAAGVETNPSKALTMALVSVASEAGLSTSELAALKWTGPVPKGRYGSPSSAGRYGSSMLMFRLSDRQIHAQRRRRKSKALRHQSSRTAE